MIFRTGIVGVFVFFSAATLAEVNYVDSEIKSVSISRGTNTLRIELENSFTTPCAVKDGLRLEADHPLANNFQSVALVAVSTGKTVQVSFDDSEPCLVSSSRITYIKLSK